MTRETPSEIKAADIRYATRSEEIRHGTFGPIVWNSATGETRVATQDDMDHLPVGDDLTPEEEASISD